ncbi:MAG: prolyl oligopeptidase family serine peptidase [Flavobacteriales bacterium]|nr:prolyl oligopeptidase family serine peptidase [Flavobacteriales bacterium]
MKKVLFMLAVALLTCGASHLVAQTNTVPMKMTYPPTAKCDSVFNLHGTSVKDPYSWLEDDNAPATVEWVKSQTDFTEKYLSKIPYREQIKQRYTELYNFEKVGAPLKAGEYYFFWKNSGLEAQGKIFVKKGINGSEELFLDLNTLSPDGTVSAGLLGSSDDNKYMAVSISEAGSDWTSIKIYDVATKKETGDVLKWVKFSGASWYKDGFYYSRYPEPVKGSEFMQSNKNHMVYYHKMGTPQTKDQLVYESKEHADWYHGAGVTEDKKYIILFAAPGTDGSETWYKKTDDAGAFKPLFTDLSTHSSVVDHYNGRFIVLTDVDAPMYRLVSVDPANPSKENWIELVPESKNLLQGVSTGGGKMFASYLQMATTRIYVMDYDAKNQQEIALPDNTGSAGGFSGKIADTELFYSFTSFTYPGALYKYDVKSGKSEVFYQPTLKFNPADYESKQVEFKSKDGTMVPMFIVHKKGLELNGKNPALLYGYGGFNISLTPSFSTSNMILLENGGVYAMPNLRGGGEFGEEWHKDGMLFNKQNVFDDFIAAAEYLISNGYTSAQKLAIHGGSNGGLLVGACMTQRPELFQVAIPAVGVMDMLRFHKWTVGKGWIPEYGCADNSIEEFKNLISYSPLHTLKPNVKYPATMVMTADHDDRVVPAHSFKFAARLQECQASPNPCIIRIETRAGHGAGQSTDQVIQSQTDKWAFMFYNMGVKLK